MTASSESPWTPENIASSETLLDVKLSLDGSKAIYHVKPSYKEDKHPSSSLWLLSVVGGDSRQITSGLFNDTLGIFHPDGKRIIFLSDRHQAGGPSQIYALSLEGGEAYPLFGKASKTAVDRFVISPNGLHIAFTSKDESSAQNEKESDDARVFGDQKNFSRLRLYSFASGEVRSLNIPKEMHIHTFTWKADSKEILFGALRQNELEFTAEEMRLLKICISKGDYYPQSIGSYHHAPSSALIWTSNGDVVEMQSFDPHSFSDALAIFTHPSRSFTSPIRLYGDDEDAAGLVDLKSDGLVAAHIAHDIDSRIDILKEGKRVFTLFNTENDVLHSWDAVRLPDGTYVFAAIRSSSILHQAPKVSTGRVKGETQLQFMMAHSSPQQWLRVPPSLKTYVLSWVASDGTYLQGIVTSPTTSDTPTTPLPTVLLVHGGPYGRDVPSYSPNFYGWSQLLASRGYLVISPNYRGGQGRGSRFAQAAHAGMGTVDWSDCESMVEEAIKLKLADPTRLGIGGWSQGGFMTAWGVTKTKNRFKAGVMGAGVSDWGQLAAESDLPEVEAYLGGSAPWTPGKRVDLNGSPIRHVEGVETPVLILHGEKDERVPVTQAISFMRGLRRHAKYPERSQLVIYPREPHVFTERKHVEDVLKRVVEHFDTWL